MGRRTHFQHITPDDLAMSGPHVWPSMNPSNASDRFLFRRPELVYRQAIRSMNQRRDEETKNRERSSTTPRINRIGIHIAHITSHGNRTNTARRKTFHHVINEDDPFQDIREFLRRLHRALNQCTPNRCIPNISVQLTFFDPETPRPPIMNWRERWL